jgi:hypothetical protein
MTNLKSIFLNMLSVEVVQYCMYLTMYHAISMHLVLFAACN